MDQREFLKLIESEVLSENWGTLTRYKIEYHRKDGTCQELFREVYDQGNGVACLLHDPETDCVLLTRQFRLPAWLKGQDTFLVEAPAGMLEGAEPEERMSLELIEETGFKAGLVSFGSFRKGPSLAL